MPEGYAVLSQRQLDDVLADGRVGPVMEVTFQTAAGVTASVRVPIEQYDAATVDAIIRRRVSEIGSVSRLEGEVALPDE